MRPAYLALALLAIWVLIAFRKMRVSTTVEAEALPSGNVAGDPTDASLTINNDDEAPSFEVTSVTGNEGDTVDVMGVVTGVATVDGRVFPAAITVWAAGVKGPDFSMGLNVALNRTNR